MFARIIAFMLLAFAPFAAANEDEHPITKVIDMLKDLREKAIADGQNEEVSWSKFDYWCSTSISTVKKAITKEKKTIEILENRIEGLKKEKKTLEKQIKELEDELEEHKKVAEEAKKKDEERTKAYEEEKKDLDDTIKSIGEAITALEEAKSTDTGLLQEKAKDYVRAALALLSMKANDSQRNVLVNFVSSEPEEDSKERPELKAEGDREKHVKKYNFKSNNVIDLLKELKLKFQDDLVAADTEETNGANQYKLEKQARDAAIAAAEESKGKKEENLGTVTGDLETAESDLENEKKDLEADEALLETTDTDCKTKSREMEERTKTRTDEIAAIEEGIKILSKTSGVSTEKPNNPTLPEPVAFLQIVDPKQKAVKLLRQTAKLVHSKALERLALEVSTHLTGPFDTVNDMIQKMIFRLMAEQTDEDKHKAWCDMETEKTESAITEKTDKIGELEATIEAEKAEEAALGLAIAEADKMVADTQKFMDEATEIRQAGKEENAKAIKDAQHAQTAIANAVAVLEDFYKESGEIPKEPWEFIQREPVTLPESPALWDSPDYTGQGGSVNIISILEKTAADFSKMEAETKAQEAEDQKEYQDAMKAHQVEKKRRQEESEAKTEEKKRLNVKIGESQKQLDHTKQELDAVEKYKKDLQPACVEGDSTYVDRKAARTKEIDALKEAQKTLKDAFKEEKTFLQIRRHA
jgi:hypothetical protein